MRTMNEIFKSVVDNVEDGIYFVDRERRITVWNNAAEKITGYRRQDVVGYCCYGNILNHVDAEGIPLCQTNCPLTRAMSEGTVQTAEILLRHREGYRVPVKVKTLPAYNDGVIIGAVEIFTPLNTPGEARFTLSEADMAMIDGLTGLPNRQCMENRLRYSLQEATLVGNTFYVLLADLDDFYSFNYYYSQQTGDVAMQRIAASLRNNIGGKDTIGRWNEDAFLGLFAVQTGADPHEIAERVRMLVSRSGVLYAGKYLSVTASVGLVDVQRGEALESVIARVEALMYQSKQKGKNCATVYVSNLQKNKMHTGIG